jgi:hypothetical protein
VAVTGPPNKPDKNPLIGLPGQKARETQNSAKQTTGIINIAGAEVRAPDWRKGSGSATPGETISTSWGWLHLPGEIS